VQATILDRGLAEKPVVVTGASSGIGAATARALGSVGPLGSRVNTAILSAYVHGATLVVDGGWVAR
jgi:hypothetical protein